VGQLHPREVTLEHVVARADAVLHVRPDAPDRRVVEVPLGGKPWHGGEAAPYERVIQRYVVEQVLRGEVKPGDALEVDAARWRTSFDLHRRYELEGLSRHVVVEVYAPKHPPADGAARYVFLQRTGEGWEWVVQGAWEGLAAKKDVERALKRSR